MLRRQRHALTTTTTQARRGEDKPGWARAILLDSSIRTQRRPSVDLGLGRRVSLSLLVLFQLLFPLHGQLQLLLNYLDLRLQVRELLHYGVPGQPQQVRLAIGCGLQGGLPLDLQRLQLLALAFHIVLLLNRLIGRLPSVTVGIFRGVPLNLLVVSNVAPWPKKNKESPLCLSVSKNLAYQIIRLITLYYNHWHPLAFSAAFFCTFESFQKQYYTQSMYFDH